MKHIRTMPHGESAIVGPLATREGIHCKHPLPGFGLGGDVPALPSAQP